MTIVPATPPASRKRDPAALRDSLTRPVALGMLSLEGARATLALAAVDRVLASDAADDAAVAEAVKSHCRFEFWLLDRAVERFIEDRERAEYRIRRAIWPMAQVGAEGNAIRDRALSVAGDAMRRHEVIAFCRQVYAAATPRRRRRPYG